ncbi:MAG: response regulator [Verrucomicrobiota bacterium]
MSNIVILCVDDETEVLHAVVRDLSAIEDVFPIEIAENAADAASLIEEIRQTGKHLAVIVCDHLMPEKDGVRFLKELNEESGLTATRKILLTGQASHEDTIEAINEAHISCYIAKPWESDELRRHVREQLSQFIVRSGIDPLPYMQALDPIIIGEAIRQKGILSDA